MARRRILTKMSIQKTQCCILCYSDTNKQSSRCSVVASLFPNETRLPKLASIRKCNKSDGHLSFFLETITRSRSHQSPTLPRANEANCLDVRACVESIIFSKHRFYGVALNQPGFGIFFPGTLQRLNKDSTLYLCTHTVTLHCLFIHSQGQANTHTSSRR